MRTVLRVKPYSYRTEKSNICWARRLIYFHDRKRPKSTGACEIRSFRGHFAGKENVSASPQNQAFNAIVFLYKYVVKKKLGVIDAVRVTDIVVEQRQFIVRDGKGFKDRIKVLPESRR